MNDAYLSVHNISKQFGTFTALRDISFEIRKGEFVCLLGPSGCGKTTLLRILAGLEQPNQGRIFVGGKEVTSLPPAQRNFGMVFQSYALFPNLTAYQNIAYGLKNRKLSKREIDEKVREALAMVDLEHIRDKYPSQLSGGQQQRIALARAIALSPDFLLLDEPLSALDAKVRMKLRREICALQDRLGITTIMVTHDQEEALTMADRIMVMNHAEIVQVGTPEDVYQYPNSPFVADFIGAINFLSASQLSDVTSGKEALMAVRPEHIRIMEVESEVGLQAVIRDVEFRGPFYRVMLQMIDERNTLTDQMVMLDVSAHVSERIRLEKDKRLSLELPMERLISFEESMVAK
ncbi:MULTISPECIES: putative 2-aminoethylphosphonate ABC transporter ATP-binding protein [Aneurinibacillus]|uniref:Carnitine transport ATP-binding protein OpuCA n=1 Tax=Aneurinibacillus thermoaerophilus TaxID=143495 RepID=A0A1G7Y1A7_ANETH|nr:MULTISPECIES: putative 2-aminoethylphosphonate ABC transporter ATP-binding protein [Aneurinibacillus]AMA72976.1 amino acid ABC transporter substrate-binding protein [Aneurinibacillus sp. XH2]MED0675920.1 putative 2-aminoethylphosphonate ABC transporter ATP-binding protein [Aneurinibacillus thermoaerophilus]MED0677805.1 putative 2-aminoethylphosphonate ABC transporter ATP-binding protein [Aneurinibacillus thermoaerophilus]MED0737554.1 putative 2-aminoethylphosphonate ABC transporter ATP-bindi